MASSALSARQRKFALEYLLDLNAAAAARRAGYSERTADRQGARLLKHVGMRRFLGNRVEKLEETTGLTTERLERELVLLCSHDPKNCFDGNGHLLPIAQMPESSRKALISADVMVLHDDSGRAVGTTTRLRWADRSAAIRLGMQRRGLLLKRSPSAR